MISMGIKAIWEEDPVRKTGAKIKRGHRLAWDQATRQRASFEGEGRPLIDPGCGCAECSFPSTAPAAEMHVSGGFSSEARGESSNVYCRKLCHLLLVLVIPLVVAQQNGIGWQTVLIAYLISQMLASLLVVFCCWARTGRTTRRCWPRPRCTT